MEDAFIFGTATERDISLHNCVASVERRQGEAEEMLMLLD
jgi:hypothetical protein